MWLFSFRNGALHLSRLPLFIVRLYRENSGAVWSVKITQLATEKYSAAGHVKRATNSISFSRNSSLTRNSRPIPSLWPNNRCLQLTTKWPRIRKYINRNTTEPCKGCIVLTHLPICSQKSSFFITCRHAYYSYDSWSTLKLNFLINTQFALGDIKSPFASFVFFSKFTYWRNVPINFRIKHRYNSW